MRNYREFTDAADPVAWVRRDSHGRPIAVRAVLEGEQARMRQVLGLWDSLGEPISIEEARLADVRRDAAANIFRLARRAVDLRQVEEFGRALATIPSPGQRQRQMLTLLNKALAEHVTVQLLPSLGFQTVSQQRQNVISHLWLALADAIAGVSAECQECRQGFRRERSTRRFCSAKCKLRWNRAKATKR